jgi:hypothetical protein
MRPHSISALFRIAQFMNKSQNFNELGHCGNQIGPLGVEIGHYRETHRIGARDLPNGCCRSWPCKVAAVLLRIDDCLALRQNITFLPRIYSRSPGTVAGLSLSNSRHPVRTVFYAARLPAFENVA